VDQAWGSYQEPPSLYWMTVAEVCEGSQLSRATVYRAMESGQLAYLQHARRGRRVEAEVFVSWMRRGFPTA
jgi:excisionase family DNA binding protein